MVLPENLDGSYGYRIQAMHDNLVLSYRNKRISGTKIRKKNITRGKGIPLDLVDGALILRLITKGLRLLT